MAAPGTPALTLRLRPGEGWWGGAVADGQSMPFGTLPHHRDLATNAGSLADAWAGANQSAPLLLSSRGRYVWSDEPFAANAHTRLVKLAEHEGWEVLDWGDRKTA